MNAANVICAMAILCWVAMFVCSMAYDELTGGVLLEWLAIPTPLIVASPVALIMEFRRKGKHGNKQGS